MPAQVSKLGDSTRPPCCLCQGLPPGDFKEVTGLSSSRRHCLWKDAKSILVCESHTGYAVENKRIRDDQRVLMMLKATRQETSFHGHHVY